MGAAPLVCTASDSRQPRDPNRCPTLCLLHVSVLTNRIPVLSVCVYICVCICICICIRCEDVSREWWVATSVCGGAVYERAENEMGFDQC
jgi:hypothetical protein